MTCATTITLIGILDDGWAGRRPHASYINAADLIIGAARTWRWYARTLIHARRCSRWIVHSLRYHSGC